MLYIMWCETHTYITQFHNCINTLNKCGPPGDLISEKIMNGISCRPTNHFLILFESCQK